MKGKENSSLPTIKIDPFDHPFIKDDIFEATVTFPQRGTPIGIITYYCDRNNMTYTIQQNNNIPWNIAFPEIQRTIGIKDPTTVQKFMEAVSSKLPPVNVIWITSSQTAEINSC